MFLMALINLLIGLKKKTTVHQENVIKLYSFFPVTVYLLS